jgi:type I restriction enzyme S subunit
MPSEWKESKWGDLASLEYGKALRTYQEVRGKYPVYGTNGLIGWHDRPLCNRDGVIIGRKGAYRGVHYSSSPFFVIDTAFYLKSKIKDLDMRFAYYELLTHDINSMDSGSAIPSTSRPEFYNLKVKLPPFHEQQAIAQVLGALDDRIGLNHQMNKTLEAIGQAIFKRWFVDFELPNEESKPYKSTNGKVIDSILKIIPDGWRTGKLDQIADLLMGISPEGTSYNDAGVGMPLLNGAADFQGSVIVPRKWTKNPIKICEKGSLLFCIRATIGNLVFADREYCLGRGVAALNPKNVAFTEFIYYILQQSLKELTSKASGSVILGLSKCDIEELPVTIPDNETLTRFHEMCSVLFGKITNQSQNSLTLASIRDCLLPRLMSGKIRVPVPQKAVEA